MVALEKQVNQKESAIRREQTQIARQRASLAAKESERNTIQARLNNTKTLDELKEQEADLQRHNEEDEAVVHDEDASPSDKEAARERVADRNDELARLQTQIAARENAFPLRERVKEILKKYGVTVTAIVLAAGDTIGAVVGAITNSLKALDEGLENGLKTIGQKTAALLPGLLGSIKTAGHKIGFLVAHTWLLILAVVAFLLERYIKTSRR